MGVNSYRFVAISILKDLCGGGVDDPLTEHNCFDKNSEIDVEKFDEYLTQDDDEEERKIKVLLALVNMVGQRI
jgi:hypothetical protein